MTAWLRARLPALGSWAARTASADEPAVRQEPCDLLGEGGVPEGAGATLALPGAPGPVVHRLVVGMPRHAVGTEGHDGVGAGAPDRPGHARGAPRVVRGQGAVDEVEQLERPGAQDERRRPQLALAVAP